MHDSEKSDSAIVAVKPPNKARVAGCGGGGAKGRGQGKRGPAKHAPDPEPEARDPGAEPRTARCFAVKHPRQEPDARIGLVRIRAGGVQQWASLPRSWVASRPPNRVASVRFSRLGGRHARVDGE